MKYRIDILPVAHIPLSRASTFSYVHAKSVKPGALVRIPFGPRTIFGIVHKSSHYTKKLPYALKPITEIVTSEPFFPNITQQYLAWEASATISSIGDVLKKALPAWLALKTRRSDIPSLTKGVASKKKSGTRPHITYINKDRGSRRLSYQKAINTALKSKKQILILAPSTIRINFLLHELKRASSAPSGRTKAAHSAWFDIRKGKPIAIIAGKNALRLPFTNLSTIILDDEGSDLYKETRSHPYTNTREGAMQLAELSGATYIAAAVLPSLETLGATKTIHSLAKIQLPGRAKLIDLKKDLPRKGISNPLKAALQNFAEGKPGARALIYLNRLGDALALTCGDCEYVFTCEHCDAPMPVYAANRLDPNNREGLRLRCRHCGEVFIPPLVCPSCRSFKLRPKGFGVAAMTDHLKTQFPTLATIVRLDSDIAKNIKSQSAIIDKFVEAKKPAILVATRMVIMHDLPKLDLVAVPAFDQLGAVPDFRADEQTIRTLLTLRSNMRTNGTFLIQTWHAERATLKTALEGSLNQFVKHELSMRAAFGWPPYFRVAKMTYANKDSAVAAREATALAHKLATLTGLSVEGPTPAFIPKIQGQYRWVVLAKWDPQARKLPEMEQELAHIVPARWNIDVSPNSLL